MIYISIEYPLQLHKQETKEVAQTDNEKIGKKGRKKKTSTHFTVNRKLPQCASKSIIIESITKRRGLALEEKYQRFSIKT